jgi:hypothetical protein
MPLTPANLYSGDNYRQRGSTDGGNYHLAEDWADIEAPQGWHQDLEDLRADNAAYSSGNRVSGPKIVISLK